MSVFLTLLKYAGLLLSAVSSIWGMLHDTIATDSNGVRRLTGAGRVALSFIVLGLLLNVVATLVEDRLADARAVEQARVEQRRLREIVVSGQPLRSLRLEWSFSDVNPEMAREMKEQDDWIREMPETNEDLFKFLYGRERSAAFAMLNRAKLLNPWLHSQVTGKWEGGDTVLLVTLDEAASTLLVSGSLAADPGEVPDEQSRDNYVKDAVRNVSSAVDFSEDLHAFYTMSPYAERNRNIFSWESLPQLDLDDPKTAVMRWNIEAADLPTMIDQAIAHAAPTAKMPETIRLVILGEIVDLPAKPGDFTRSDVPLPTRIDTGAKPARPITHARSRLRLEPNGVREAAIDYEMEFLGVQAIENPNPELERHYCRAAVWEGKRTGSR